MEKWRCIVLGILLIVTVNVSSAQKSHSPPKYVINLDLPPEERWAHVVKDFPGIPTMVKNFTSLYVPEIFFPLIKKIGDAAETYMKQPYLGEINGIAKALNTSNGVIAIMNVVYDLTAFCTSIVCQDSGNKIWHARNLDYGGRSLMEDWIIEATYTRGVQVQYTTVGPVGFVGVVTGQRPRSFTVSLDQRSEGSILWNLLIGILDRQAEPIGFLVRDALEKSNTFEEAITRLSSQTTAAPAYFILGGVKPGEGAVITKSRFKTVDIWRMNVTSSEWYLVETNFDHWIYPEDIRRKTATAALNRLGRGDVGMNGLKKVLTTKPVMNNSTIHTTIMSAGDPGLLTTWVWG